MLKLLTVISILFATSAAQGGTLEDAAALKKTYESEADHCFNSALTSTQTKAQLTAATAQCFKEWMTIQEPKLSPFDDTVQVAALLIGQSIDGRDEPEVAMIFKCERRQTSIQFVVDGAPSVKPNIEYRLGRDPSVSANWSVSNSAVYLVGRPAIELIKSLSDKYGETFVVRASSSVAHDRRFLLQNIRKPVELIGKACGW